MNSYSERLGRLPAPDPRDRHHLMAAVLSDAAPLERSISYRRGPILDQGSTSSCVGHGWRAWLNGAPIRQVTAGPGALTIYRDAQRVDEWPGEEPVYEGTSVRAGAKVLQAAGLISRYVWAFDEPTMRQWLLSRAGGVVIGVNWYTSMFNPSPAGMLSISGRLAGGHCVWVRGYNRPRNAYRLQNSWGIGWGQGGQAWLRAEDMARLLAEDGEACCGIEVRPGRSD